MSDIDCLSQILKENLHNSHLSEEFLLQPDKNIDMGIKEVFSINFATKTSNINSLSYNSQHDSNQCFDFLSKFEFLQHFHLD
jgi:hypothetical protein